MTRAATLALLYETAPTRALIAADAYVAHGAQAKTFLERTARLGRRFRALHPGMTHSVAKP